MISTRKMSQKRDSMATPDCLEEQSTMLKDFLAE